MLLDFFPLLDELTTEPDGRPVRFGGHGIQRAWNGASDRFFPIELFIYKGTIITESTFRDM